jgi:hypothetical protein
MLLSGNRGHYIFMILQALAATPQETYIPTGKNIHTNFFHLMDITVLNHVGI